MSTWPASKKCSYCQEAGRPSHCGMCAARNIIDDLERQLAEAQARLRKANCDYGDGWLNDDLECQVDVEPWCGKHAVLYYIRAGKKAQGKLDAAEKWALEQLNDSGHHERYLAAVRGVLRILHGEKA